MEATKRRCVLGCEDKAHYWGSLRFCDLLLDLDTINERKRVCLDKNVCLLCLCPGHRQHTCRANITCTWCPPQKNKHNSILCTNITEAEIIERLKTKDGKLAYKIDCEYSVFALNCSYEEKDATTNSIQIEEEESSDSDDSDEETNEPGVNSNFLSAVSAFQHGLKDEENMLEESNMQKANT